MSNIDPVRDLVDTTMTEQTNTLSEKAEHALNDELAKQVARIAGAVWVHNWYVNGVESITLHTPEGREVETELKPVDVTELIDAFLLPLMKLAHKEAWKLTASAEFDMWLDDEGQLSEYGQIKWKTLMDYIARAVDYTGYSDAKH